MSGPLDDSQMHAEVIENPRRVKRLAGDVRFGELAPESGVFDQLGRGGVVGVGVLPVGREDQPRPHLAKNGRQGPAMKQRGLEAPIGKAEVLPPGASQRGVGRGGLCSRDARGFPAVSALRRSGPGSRASSLAGSAGRSYRPSPARRHPDAEQRPGRQGQAAARIGLGE